MPTPRWGLGVAAINGILYAVGGTTSTDRVATVEAYDPTTDIWMTKASLPSGRSFLGVAAINGILYAVGGYTNASIEATVLAYDPSTNTWSTKASMPAARGVLAVGVISGTLYALGGDNNGAHADMYAYDPAVNTWTSKASMPTPRWGLSIATIDGILYAVGGNQTGVGDVATVEAYDPTTDTWATKASLPSARENLGVAAIDGILYAAGGNPNSSVEAYDPATDTWTTLASMPTSRWGMGVVAINGILYAVGGVGGPTTIEALTPEPTSNPTCVSPPAGLVSWWPGDGNAEDITGSNGGAMVGNVTFVPGMVGQAFHFFPGPTGNETYTAYVDVGNSPSLQVSSGDFTVDAWVYPEAICEEFPGAGCIARGILGKMAVAPNIDGWRFFLEGPKLTLNAGGQTFNTGTHAELPNFSVTAGVWSHVAMVKRGNSIELFRNGGQLFTSTPINIFYDSHSAPMYIGSDPSEGNTFYGLIDEVELFDRALSSAEVQSIFDAGSAGKCKSQAQGTVTGLKYYDANTNGQLDAGEAGIPNWRIVFSNGISDSLATASDGTFGPLSLTSDDYSFTERQPIGPSTWIQTGNLVDQSISSSGNTSALSNMIYALGIVDGGITDGLNFGNVCIGAGGGHSLGSWSNKNGQALFSGADLALMVSLNLRNASGSNFDPGSYAQFKNWLLNASATNMAYMLSAQLAAMELSVAHGFVNGTGLLYAPGTSSANANGFATVNAVMSEANSELGLHGFTQSGNISRPYQESLKNALDKGNNNQSFVQLGPAQCPAPAFP
jgi:hypothetical protein